MTAEPGVADLDASFLVVLSALTYGCLRQGGFRRDGFAVVAVLTLGAGILSLIRYLPHRRDLRPSVASHRRRSFGSASFLPACL